MYLGGKLIFYIYIFDTLKYNGLIEYKSCTYLF